MDPSRYSQRGPKSLTMYFAQQIAAIGGERSRKMAGRVLGVSARFLAMIAGVVLVHGPLGSGSVFQTATRQWPCNEYLHAHMGSRLSEFSRQV
jgi:hypothetical protein